MNKETANSIQSDGIRYIGAGGVNTLITVIIYQILLLLLPHSYAYSISWIIGIIFLVTIYPTKVFTGGKDSTKRRVAIATSYLIVFGASIQCLNMLVRFGIHERIAIFIILIFSSLLNFLLMRYLIRGYIFNSPN